MNGEEILENITFSEIGKQTAKLVRSIEDTSS